MICTLEFLINVMLQLYLSFKGLPLNKVAFFGVTEKGKRKKKEKKRKKKKKKKKKKGNEKEQTNASKIEKLLPPMRTFVLHLGACHGYRDKRSYLRVSGKWEDRICHPSGLRFLVKASCHQKLVR